MNINPSLLAAAMAHVEGFYSTKSLAFHHKNPGNLRDTPKTYRYFDTIEAGWEALCTDILYNEHKTVGAFLAKYAPNTENDTAAYVKEVCTLTGYTPETEM